MEKSLKRLLSLAVALVMVLSMVPFNGLQVFAAEETTDTQAKIDEWIATNDPDVGSSFDAKPGKVTGAKVTTTSCPFCGQEAVEWTPVISAVGSQAAGHYYFNYAEGYAGHTSLEYLKTNGNVCLYLNGKDVTILGRVYIEHNTNIFGDGSITKLHNTGEVTNKESYPKYSFITMAGAVTLNIYGGTYELQQGHVAGKNDNGLAVLNYGYTGATVNIYNAELKNSGYGEVIRMTRTCTANVYNSTFEGGSGYVDENSVSYGGNIYMTKGTVTLTDTTVTGGTADNGSVYVGGGTLKLSGKTDIDVPGLTLANGVKANVSGLTGGSIAVTGAVGDVIATNGNETVAEYFTVCNTDGTVDTTRDVVADESGKLTIACVHNYNYSPNNDGTHTGVCANGCGIPDNGTCDTNGDDDVCSKCGYKAKVYVAQVGGTKYESLQEAIVAAAPSGTVELLSDVTVDKWIMISQSLSIGSGQIITVDEINGLTIDGNNKSLTIKSIESATNGNRLFYDATKLNIKDLTINYVDAAANQGGIGLTSGTIENVIINGGVGVFPGDGEITISGCTFNTNGCAIYNEEERDNLVVTGNTFNTATGQYAIYLRGNTTFTDNTVITGKVNVTNSATGVISGNDFGTERFKVYNGATATISNNTINNLVFNEPSAAANATITGNILSAEAQDALDAVTPGLPGTGTEEDPFLITDLDDLIWFQEKVDEQAADGSTQFAGKYFKLTADINLAGINWNPIGSMSGDHASFKGVFDGGGHTIRNLNCQQAGEGLGLFAYTSDNAVIKNLTLENVTVKSTNNSNYVGAVVGNAYASTKIENVHVTGAIDISGRGYIGGIAGHGYVVMNNVSVIGEGTISSTFWCAGGILGYGGEGATNITNAKVEGTGENYLTVTSAAGGLGAIVGMAEDNNGTQPISGSNLSAKNVIIKTYTGAYGDGYANYALGYLYGGNPTSVLTGTLSVENVNIETSSGEEPEVNDAVASVEGAIYFDLQAAVDAADGKIVTVLHDITLTETVNVTGTVVLELNGKTISGVNNEAKASAVINNTGKLTIQDSVGTGKITSNALNPDPTNNPVYANNTINNRGELTVKSGTVENASTGYACYAIDSYPGAVTVIEGGVIQCVNGSHGDAIRLFASTTDTTSLLVTGGAVGTIWTQNPSNGKAADVKYDVTIADDAMVGTLYLEPTANCDVEITGGTIGNVVLYATDAENADRNASAFITGGKFSNDISAFVAEGFKATLVDGMYQIVTFNPVAEVNAEQYESLQEALDAAAAGTGNVTVEILRDVDLSGVDWNPVTVSGPGYPLVTVNGNNKTITGLNDMLFAGTWAGKSGLIINDLTIANSNIANDVEDEKGTVGVGAFIGYPQASATITLNNCHLVNSTVEGGHWTGGLIGMAGGYNGNDGPVFMNLTITGCSVTGSTITGKGSAGGVIGHGSCAAWTNVVIENTTVSGNTITSTGSSTNKAGSVMGTIGAAGKPATAAGETKTGGASVSATTSGNTVTSGGTAITTIYGRQGSESGMLTVTGGTYEAYPIEENVSYAAPKADYKIIENADGTYGLTGCQYVAQVGDKKFESLADALAAVTDGSVLTIFEGTYDAALVINKSNVTVMGEGNVTLNGVPSLKGTNYKVENIDFVYATGSSNLSGSGLIKDCTFTATAADGNTFRYCYGTQDSAITFEGCTLTAAGWALHFDSAPGLDLTITDCVIDGRVALGGNLGSLNATDTAFENAYVNVWGTEEAATFTGCEFIDVPYVFTGYTADNTVNFNSCTASAGGSTKAVTEIIWNGIDNTNTLIYVDGVLKTGVAKIGETHYATLAEAINAGGAITVLRDVTEEIQVNDGTEAVVDLNGKTLNGCFKPFKGKLTLKNGSIVNTNASYSAIEINAGELVLTDVNVTSSRHAVRIDGAVTATINGGNYSVNATSGTRHAVNVSGAANVTIQAGTFVGPAGTTMDSGSAVNVQNGATVTIEGGNFSKGKNNTLGVSGTLIVKGGIFDQNPVAYVLEGCVYTVKADGTFGVYETLQEAVNASAAGDTVVLTGDVELAASLTVASIATTYALNADQGITLDLNGKTITSDVSTVVVDGGELIVKDSGTTGKIITTDATGAYEAIAVKNGGKLTLESGTVESGLYGIYAYTSGGTVIMTGGTVKAPYMAIAVGGGSAAISGGTLICDSYIVYDWDKNLITITGGTFSKVPNAAYIAYGYGTKEVAVDSETYYQVIAIDPVAYIGAEGYYTIEAAIKAANDGDTIIVNSCTVNGTVSVNKDITLQAAEGATVTINGDLRVTANGATVKGLTVVSGDTALYINAKDVLVEGCEITGAWSGMYQSYTTGKVTFKDSKITGKDAYAIHFDGSAGGEIVIDNCELSGWTSFASSIKNVTVTDTDFVENDKNNYVRFYQENVVIDGCTFNEKMRVDLAVDNATVTVTNSTVNNGNVEDLFGDADIVNSEITVDGVKLVREAKIGNAYYATLQEALDAAVEGDTIELLAPVVVAAGETLTLDKAVTITYTSNVAGEDMITNRGTLVIDGATLVYVNTDITASNVTVSTISCEPGSVLEVKSGVVKNDSANHAANGIYAYAIDILTNGNLGDVTATISGGEVISTNYMAIRQFNNGDACKNTLNISGGYIYGAKRAVQIHFKNNAAYTTITDGKIEGGDYALCFLTTSENLTVSGGEFIGSVWYSGTDGFISGGTFDEAVEEGYCAEGYVPADNGDGTYGVKVGLPKVEITDIKGTLTDADPDLTFALNFAIPNIEDLTEEYLNELFAVYGDYYVDYVLTISGLSQQSVVFNANGDADGYLAGQYDAFGLNWVAVPFEDVVVNNGQSLYIMEYAAKLMGKQGLRFTLAEVAAIVQNFDCGVYFTPEFLAANPDLKVELELKVFTEDAEGNKIENIDVATNVFENNYAAAVTADGKQTKYYATFPEAYAAAGAGDTVELLRDVTLTGKLTVDKAITIDGNGHKIVADETAVWYTTGSKPLYLKQYKTHLLGINADNIALKDVVLDCNDNAAGINIYCAQNVVFDSVSIINATKGMAALTVNGSTLTVKNALTAQGNSIALDISNGSGVTSALGVTVEEGTVFDLGNKTVKFASVANNNMTGAVDANNEPYFAAMDNAYYYTLAQMESRTTAYSNGLKLLNDVTLNKDLTVSGTLDLNGHDLTVADGKVLKVSGNLAITGEGNFAGNVKLTTATATLVALESVNVSTDLEGYKVVYEDGTHKLAQIVYVAEVNGTKYETLQAAIDAAGEGDTVKLLTDIELTTGVTVPEGKIITLDLTGKTITGKPAEAKAFSVITNKGELTITGNGSVICDHQLAGSTGYAVNAITNSGTLTIDGATIENKSTATNQIGYAIDNNSGTGNAIVVIESGVVKASGSNYYDGIRQFCNSQTNENSVTVEGGTVSSIWMQNPSDGTTEKDTKDVKGEISITGGTVNALYLEPSSAFEAEITGGYVGKVEYFTTSEGRDLTDFITGGTFGMDVTAYCAPGYKAVDNGDGTYGVVVNEDIVAWNMQTGEEYETVEEAVRKATEGQTIQMLADSNESGELIAIRNRRTLDLNGYTLTADEVMTSSTGSRIMDSTNGKGLLKVAKENLTLVTNDQMLVWKAEDEGYRFATVTYGTQVKDLGNGVGQFNFYLKEKDGIVLAELADGMGDNDGLSIQVVMTYTNSQNATSTLYFDFPVELVQQYANVKTYLTMTIKGLDTVTNVSFAAVVKNGNVQVQSEAVPY